MQMLVSDVVNIVNEALLKVEDRILLSLANSLSHLKVESVEVGRPLARELYEIYRLRAELFENLPASYDGWEEFMQVLSEREGEVRLIGIRSADQKCYVVVLAEDLSKLLTCMLQVEP